MIHTSTHRFLLNAGSSSNNSQSNPQATPAQYAAMYNQYLPQALGTTSSFTQPAVQDIAGAAAASNPTLTASGLSQLAGYAPGYAQVGNNLSQQQAGNTAQLLAGNGGVASLEAAGLSNILNPAQAASNGQAANLVNSINLNGLSGGEQSAVDRSLSQSNYATGNLGLDNATTAVSNAMNFGNALQAKRTALGSALGAAGGVAANQNTFAQPVQTALNAGNTSGNFGLSTFNPTQANQFATTPFSFASSFGNQLAGVSAASNSNSSGGSTQGGICYLTTACCEHKGLPDDCEELTVLRKFRDSYVAKELVQEYYRLAPAIVERIKDKPPVLDYVHATVQLCVKDIKAGRFELALNKYKNMVVQLSTV